MNSTPKEIYDSFVGFGTTQQDIRAAAEMIRVGIATGYPADSKPLPAKPTFVTLPTAESLIAAIKEG